MYPLDHSATQLRRETASDERGIAWQEAITELTELVRVWGTDAITAELAKLPNVSPAVQWEPQCAQCQHWHEPRTLTRGDQSRFTTPAHCSLRAASDLTQMPQQYAAQCHFYEETCPF